MNLHFGFVFQLYPQGIQPEDIGYGKFIDEDPVYVGGETMALAHLADRLQLEEEAFR